MNCCTQDLNRMKGIGICLKTDQKDFFAETGADYAEFPFTETATMTEAEFDAFRNWIQDHKVSCPVMTQLLPKKGSIVMEPDRFSAYEAYLRAGFERAVSLGTRIVILGNAGARNIPSLAMKEIATQRLSVFLQQAAVLAKEYDVCICLEPLNRIQSNLINTIEEAADVIRNAADDHLGIVWDDFHFKVEKDKIESIIKNKDFIMHCHTASLLRRGIPDLQEEKTFLDCLQEIGYTGRISFEFDKLPFNTDKLAQAIEHFRRTIGE